MKQWIILILMAVAMIETVNALCWNPLELFCIFGEQSTDNSSSTNYYYLANWEWQTEEDMSFWRCPDGDCLGLIDLRSIPQMSKAGGIPEGYGFFVYDKEKNIKNAVFLGNDLNTIAKGKSETILDFLWNELTIRTDPTGMTATKPLMPNQNLNLELHLAGQKVKSEKFDVSKHPFVLEVIRNDYRRIRQEDIERGSDNYKRVLDAWEEKYGLDYKNFIPADLPDEGKLPHKTLITDDFNRATLGSDWTATDGTWDILNSDDVRYTGATAVGIMPSIRHNTNLSTDDHYAQMVLLSAAETDSFGQVIRFASAANTYYWAQYRPYGARRRIWRVVNNALTELASNDAAWSYPVTVKLQADGSLISLYQAGVLVTSVTNTVITGNTQVGILSFDGSDTSTGDDFEAGDLAAGGDTTKPIVNATINKSITNVLQNDVINFTANFTDDSGNVTWANFSINTSVKQYFNFSINGSSLTTRQISQNITITLAAGNVLNGTWKVSDNSSNLAQNETIFTVASADTCSPTCPLTADYIFQCSDNCNNVNCNAGGYNILITGTGSFSGTLTNYNNLRVEGTDANNKCYAVLS